jgi:hypothetical protein
VASATAAAQVNWLWSMLEEMTGISVLRLIIRMHNTVVIALAKNPVLRS